MARQANPLFELNSGERTTLKAFIRGTQHQEASGNGEAKESIWTQEAIKGVNDLLNGNFSGMTAASYQEVFCALSEILDNEKEAGSDKELSEVLVKFLHHLVAVMDWTTEKVLKKDKVAKSKKEENKSPAPHEPVAPAVAA